jgi:hypothetical protein
MEPAVAMRTICCENRVPQTGKTRARLTVDGTPASAHRRISWTQSAVGPLTDAAVAGLRRVFRDRNGLLHTVFSANGPHRFSPPKSGSSSGLFPAIHTV